jgi:transposase
VREALVVGQRFVEGSREQGFLLPPEMREWLPSGHLVWVVVEALEWCETGGLRNEYRLDGRGRPAYEPVAMATLLLYAYAVGERSSRQIERRCREDVAFRVAAAGLQPDHVTIARFRRRHAAALIGLFGEVLRLCAGAGLLRLGLVAIDGTKVRADANKNRLAPPSPEQEAERLLTEAETQDEAEDELSEAEQTALRGLVPAELADPAGRAKQFAHAAEQRSEHVAVPEHAPRAEPRSARAPGEDPAPPPRAPRRTNKTDPASRMMTSPHGWIQGYNAQVAVDESHLVLSCTVSANPSDYRLLEPMITLTEHELREAAASPRPGCYLADSGYWNGNRVEQLERKGRRLLVKPNGRPRRKGRSRQPAVARMQRRLSHPANRRRFHRRQALAEPVIAQIKIGERLSRFHLRGLAGAQLEWTLACTAHNLRRLHRNQTTNP